MKIWRGSPFLIDDWPYMVSLLTKDDTVNVDASANPWKLRCGGVIITKSHVLTSAWCLKSIVENEFATKGVVVRGNTEYWECACGRKRDHTIASYIIHENFKEPTPFKTNRFYENDIGIVTVENPFLGLYENPAPYGDGSTFWNSRSKSTVVIGWGFYDQKNQIQEQLHGGPISVLQSSLCSKIYGKALPPHTYCARNQHYTFGPCEYDTGGPHFGHTKNGYILIGIISSGEGCVHKPAVFTNISYYVDWINEKINGHTRHKSR